MTENPDDKEWIKVTQVLQKKIIFKEMVDQYFLIFAFSQKTIGN